MTPLVQSVLGDVPVPHEGWVLAHEHLAVRRETVGTQFPHLYDADAELRETIAAVRTAGAHGVRLICDPTPAGMGRDIRRQVAVARASGVAVVAATGLFTFDGLDPYFEARPADRMAEAFVHDLTVGVQGTGHRAGFLKCATDAPGVTPSVKKVLRAVARAHRATGFPVMTHSTVANDSATDQLAILRAEGVDPAHVVIGHLGDTGDLRRIRAVLDEGAYVGLDRFGQDDRLPVADRFDVLARLCSLGYADRLIVSHDYQCGGRGDRFPDAADLARHRPEWALTLLPDQLPGQLADRGLDPALAGALLRDNPTRWLRQCAPC